MARAAERIHIPNLDRKFVTERNPDKNWVVEMFNENISKLNEFAGNLPESVPWELKTVEQLKGETVRLFALGRPLQARVAGHDRSGSGIRAAFLVEAD